MFVVDGKGFSGSIGGSHLSVFQHDRLSAQGHFLSRGRFVHKPSDVQLFLENQALFNDQPFFKDRNDGEAVLGSNLRRIGSVNLDIERHSFHRCALGPEAFGHDVVLGMHLLFNSCHTCRHSAFPNGHDFLEDGYRIVTRVGVEAVHNQSLPLMNLGCY